MRGTFGWKVWDLLLLQYVLVTWVLLYTIRISSNKKFGGRALQESLNMFMSLRKGENHMFLQDECVMENLAYQIQSSMVS